MNKQTGGHGVTHRIPGQGITLRDYFAAKAMQAFLAQNFGGAIRDEFLAVFSYAMADAMLKAREQ